MGLLRGTAMVTGGGSGIGRAVAISCAQNGCSAIEIADVNVDGLHETQSDVQKVSDGIQLLAIQVDVSQADSVAEMVSKVVGTFGSLDYGKVQPTILVPWRGGRGHHFSLTETPPQSIQRGRGKLLSDPAPIVLSILLNNLGNKISVKAHVAASSYSIAEYDDIQSVNSRGLLLCVQAEIRAMSRQEPRVTTDGQSAPRGQRGSIVNIASICSHSIIPDMLPYVVSKHAVLGITRAAGLEHAADRIRINAISPGLVETPMITARRRQLQERSDDDAAPAAVAPRSLDTWAPADMYTTPIGRLALSEEIADACVFLASSMASHIVARSITVDGGRSAA